jgi:DNA (cytosine-5)-methyltransferase 1
LKSELREHKNLSNKEIAERLDVAKTTVDHRFRIDSCFAIPDAEIRFKLKELL